jgi:hypothetical protein
MGRVFLWFFRRRSGSGSTGPGSRGASTGANNGSNSLAIGLPEPAEPKGGVRAIGLDGRKGGVTAVAEMEKPGGSTGEDCIG